MVSTLLQNAHTCLYGNTTSKLTGNKQNVHGFYSTKECTHVFVCNTTSK